MKAGPKGAALLDPLPDSEGLGPAEWIERWCVTPRGHGALGPLRLAPFQLQVLDGIYAAGRRQAVVVIPRGNGKSTLLAAVLLYELFAGQWSAEVVVVAPTERQSRHLLEQARRMVDLSPELSDRAQVYAGRIKVPGRDAEAVALPASPDKLQGLDPTLAVVDELAEVAPATYEALDLALGKRAESRVVAISTPGGDREGPLWRLVEHGRRHPDDPRLWLREWSAPEGCALDDEEAWGDANPALDLFLDREALRSNLVTSREDSFRTYRLGQWTGAVGSWLPWGTWEPLARDRVLEPGERIVVGFDGSASGDSTALVASTLDPDPFVAVLGVWEDSGDPRWRVPRAEVLDTVREVMGRYDVAELAADPWGWRTELEELERTYPGRVLQWPTNVVGRMAPATDRTYALVAEGRLTHDGDEALARHVRNTVARRTPQGDVPTKAGKSSPRKIDLCVAMILAVDRAAWHRGRPARGRGAYVFR
jgi:phage terminase large subunit-like protein